MDRAKWPGVWEESVTETFQSLIRQATSQFKQMASKEKRFHILALYREYFKEELKKTLYIKKGKGLPRGVDREEVLKSESHKKFFK